MQHDPAKHPRQPNHSEHMAKIAAAVNPRVQNEPAPTVSRNPHRPDQGRAKHSLGNVSPSGRGAHN